MARCRIRDDGWGVTVPAKWIETVECETGGSALVRYTGGGSEITWQFDATAEIAQYFNQSTGIFKLDTDANDQDVIVNFGEYLEGTAPRVTNLQFVDNVNYDAPIVSTVINTRYMSADTSAIARTDSINWDGGNTDLSQVMFIPTNGLALLVHTVDTPGDAKVYMGTIDNPALFYVTGCINRFNANGALYGTTIVLGNITDMRGTPGFWFDPGYIENLPDYLQQQFGSSGFAEVLFWRELPPSYL